MSTASHDEGRIPMSQRERDRLRVLHSVLDDQRTQVEAARLLRLTTRHVRRLLLRLQQDGDTALVHGLRGRPSNRRTDPQLRSQVLQVYRQDFPDFGPTFAVEKLAERGLVVSADTLRRWLVAEGLWQARRQREQHRRRRPRRACFGELVQMDTSIHDWLEGRGEDPVLMHMIDDATSRLLARFYDADTTVNHFDLLWRWLQAYGRPLALYTDRHSIFEVQNQGQAVPEAETQFGRALRELAIELIRARSPQAKGRVERSFETAQDRVVKELRLAGVTTIAGANAVLDDGLLAKHNRLFSVPALQAGDAHRTLGSAFNVAAILSVQEPRTVAHDYTVRFLNRHYQLDPPIYPGERRGKVLMEMRLDGSLAIRFGEHYLKYHEIAPGTPAPGGSAPQTPRSLPPVGPTPVREEEGSTTGTAAEPPGVPPTDGRSGRTAAEPYPPDGDAEDTRKGPHRPAADHPWRRGFRTKRKD